jgi:hypothetical protein
LARTPVDADPSPTAAGVDDPPADPAASRRARFRASVQGLANRSTADDLVRWMLVPGSIAVVLGFGVMLLGWIGAARTAREIEQIPYLISGGLIGLALVVLGGLLLVSTFWVAVFRKLQSEQGVATAELDALRRRVAELETTRSDTRPRASRPSGTSAPRSRARTSR